MNWSRAIGNVGRTLIASGTLILLFVVYQLWGTALHERRAQNSLRTEFDIALQDTFGSEADQMTLDEVFLPATIDARAVVQASSTLDDETERLQSGELGTTEIIDTSFLPEGLLSPDFGPPPPPALDGDAVAQIRIPRIGITKTVVEGVSTDALKNGPGHYPGTPLPGQAGNAAIAGHRTTYGAPFFDIDELEENDLIYVTTLQGSFVYRVVEQLIVSAKDVYVLDASEDSRLTLTTCHPRYSARQRLVIVAELIGDAADSDPDQTVTSGEFELPSEDFGSTDPSTTQPSITQPSTTQPSTTDVTPTTEAAPVDDVAVVVSATSTSSPPRQATVFTEVTHGGIDGERGNRWPSVLLGLLAASVAFAIWYTAQRWHKWATYGLGAPVFLVVLFFFFEAFSSLLPPGV